MSYTPTEWETADIVTATRMNALETAVGEMNMSYTPNTWSDGDILTAAKMNALEQAVASGGGGGSSDAKIIHGTFYETLSDESTEVEKFYTVEGIINRYIDGTHAPMSVSEWVGGYEEFNPQIIDFVCTDVSYISVASDLSKPYELTGDATYEDGAITATGDFTFRGAGWDE